MSEWASIMLFFKTETLEKLKKYGEENNMELKDVIYEAVNRFINEKVEGKKEAR